MPQPDWNDRYRTGETPWDTSTPDSYLVEFIHSSSIEKGKALDVGCGTGTNTLWLANEGFSVIGIDMSSVAIAKAHDKIRGANADCRFETLDFLRGTVPNGPFDLVFDRGCFHVFDKASDRGRFAEHVASLLAPGGTWLSLIGSTEGHKRDYGPPRRSARDVVGAIEPVLQILELRSINFHVDLPQPVAAWFCLSRLRDVPAQQPTERD